MDLSYLIWIPLAAGLLAALTPERVAPRVALVGTLVTLGVAIGVIVDFDTASSGLQMVTDFTWIEELGIHYKIGVDGLNVVLLLMTALLFAGTVLATNVSAPLKIEQRKRLFYFHLLLGETAVLGAFCAQDLALFVAFFDLMLVPFYFITGIWGKGENRVSATTKLVVYTLVGSLLMLAAAVATAVIAEPTNGGTITFVLTELQQLPLPKHSQEWLFLCFAAAFLVKMPAFPFHGWMPDAYRAMPLPALAVFSAVLSKVGAYGFLKLALPLFPQAAQEYQTLFLVLAVISILYGSVMAFTQNNVRLVLGYSSIAQLGFIMLGIFSLNPQGQDGALLQMINHGLVVAPLFFIVALLAKRADGSENIKDLGGIAFRAPILAALFLIVALATLAIPGSANFAGEFLILLGAFDQSIAIAVIASLGVVLASVYVLRVFIRSMHNRVGPEVDSREITIGDGLALIPLVLVVIAFALYPQFALDRSESQFPDKTQVGAVR